VNFRILALHVCVVLKQILNKAWGCWAAWFVASYLSRDPRGFTFRSLTMKIIRSIER